jgi:HAD superfamily hydrolase (TIGR01490 family)
MKRNAPNAAAIAFFDLDGTLVVGQTQRLLVSYMHRQGMVGVGFLIAVGLWFAAYRLGLVKATDNARGRAAGLMRGRSAEEVAALMDTFTREELVPRLHGGALTALRGHQERGDEVVIVSAALMPVVEGLARHLRVGSCEGTRLAVLNGVFTGMVSGKALYGPEKALAARRILDERGTDAESCSAYADHETDVELLELVGHAVAVNPRPGLAAVAEQRGWRIMF